MCSYLICFLKVMCFGIELHIINLVGAKCAFDVKRYTYKISLVLRKTILCHT